MGFLILVFVVAGIGAGLLGLIQPSAFAVNYWIISLLCFIAALLSYISELLKKQLSEEDYEEDDSDEEGKSDPPNKKSWLSPS